MAIKNRKRELSDVELRLLERQKVARRAVFAHFAKWICVCAAVSLIVWGLLYSPLFKVHQVVINIVCPGNSGQMYDINSTPEEVPAQCGATNYIDRGQLDSLSNSLMQDESASMVWLSEKSLEADYDAIAGIKSSSVAKAWPSKLIIALEPRISVAREGENVIDSDGTVLGLAKDGLPPLPEFQVASIARQDVLQLLDAVRIEPAFSGLIKASATGRDDISLTRADGVAVIFGNTNNLTLKLAVTNQILSTDLGGRKTIDVSSPTDPITK